MLDSHIGGHRITFCVSQNFLLLAFFIGVSVVFFLGKTCYISTDYAYIKFNITSKFCTIAMFVIVDL